MNTWNRLKERIRKCRRGIGFWESLLWTMIGIFIPSVVSAYLDYQAQPANKFTITPWMVVTLVSLVAAMLSAVGLTQSVKQETDSIDAVMAEMEEIQIRFTRAPN